jgi:multidrug transporter EmrE-like cation transporter
MMGLKLQLAVFRQGFLIVTLTASNVGMISGQHWFGAGVVGFLISFVWFTNARTAAHTSVPYAREWYALGAGMGTLFGMGIVRVLYG